MQINCDSVLFKYTSLETNLENKMNKLTFFRSRNWTNERVFLSVTSTFFSSFQVQRRTDSFSFLTKLLVKSNLYRLVMNNS